MAVNNLNPAVVPPTAAEIATAVAAPSAATIAAAVAAPSAATIAAAVAAPSAATIAATVAAPSSATIASAVAAAVPTTAGITSIVQANAGSPYGGTITNLGYVSGNGTSTVTFSSLSGYKYLRLYWFGCKNTLANSLSIRFNGDTTSICQIWGQENYGFNSGYATAYSNAAGGYLSLEDIHTSQSIHGTLIIPNSNSAHNKIGEVNFSFYNGSYRRQVNGNFVYPSTSAISTITIFNAGGTFTNASPYGFYLVGAN